VKDKDITLHALSRIMFSMSGIGLRTFQYYYISVIPISSLGCGPLANVSKHLIDQSEGRILQINQSKNLKHL